MLGPFGRREEEELAPVPAVAPAPPPVPAPQLLPPDMLAVLNRLVDERRQQYADAEASDEKARGIADIGNGFVRAADLIAGTRPDENAAAARVQAAGTKVPALQRRMGAEKEAIGDVAAQQALGEKAAAADPKSAASLRAQALARMLVPGIDVSFVTPAMLGEVLKLGDLNQARAELQARVTLAGEDRTSKEKIAAADRASQERIAGGKLALDRQQAAAKAAETAKSKHMSVDQVNQVASIESALKQLEDFGGKLGGFFESGPAAVLSRNVPFTTNDAEKLTAEGEALLQVIGKALEGGVLKADDIPRYRAMLPQVSDRADLQRSKIENVKKLLVRQRDSLLQTAESSGLNTGSLKPSGATATSPAAAGPTMKGSDGKAYVFRNGAWETP